MKIYQPFTDLLDIQKNMQFDLRHSPERPNFNVPAYHYMYAFRTHDIPIVLHNTTLNNLKKIFKAKDAPFLFIEGFEANIIGLINRHCLLDSNIMHHAQTRNIQFADITARNIMINILDIPYITSQTTQNAPFGRILETFKYADAEYIMVYDSTTKKIIGCFDIHLFRQVPKGNIKSING